MSVEGGRFPLNKSYKQVFYEYFGDSVQPILWSTTYKGPLMLCVQGMRGPPPSAICSLFGIYICHYPQISLLVSYQSFFERSLYRKCSSRLPTVFRLVRLSLHCLLTNSFTFLRSLLMSSQVFPPLIVLCSDLFISQEQILTLTRGTEGWVLR